MDIDIPRDAHYLITYVLHSKPNEEAEENNDKFSSIEELTKSFVIGLQEGFPSTVPTIFRTGDKLLLESNNTIVLM